jgi:hypothetical protein
MPSPPATRTVSHGITPAHRRPDGLRKTQIHRYNRTARPFNWKFTAGDLTALLRRIRQREQPPAGQQATLPQAA